MLLCHPESFAKYLAISTVVAYQQYQDKSMFDSLKKTMTDSKKISYFSIGSEEKDDRVGDYIGRFRSVYLKICKLPELTSKIEIIAGENHASVVTPSIWRGLNFFNSCK